MDEIEWSDYVNTDGRHLKHVTCSTTLSLPLWADTRKYVEEHEKECEDGTVRTDGTT